MNVVLKSNGIWHFCDALCLVKSPKFPYNHAKNENYKNKFLLGIGGNLGQTQKIFERFFMKFSRDPRFFVLQSSKILKNKPFGYKNQNDFLNAVLLVQTSLFPRNVLKILNHYEKNFKRQRSFKNAPRTLDLDILDFSVKVRNDERLIVPHPGFDERISVIFPFGILRR